VKIAPTAQVNNSRSRSGRIGATKQIATYAATDHVATPNAFSQKIRVKKAIHLSAALEWRSSGHRIEVELRLRGTTPNRPAGSPRQRSNSSETAPWPLLGSRRDPRVATVDGVVGAVLVDPGAEAGRAELEGHYNYTANRVIFATLQTFCETALVQS
jgi:hypothetical protein